jgi:5-methyltetrahydrofolate--homocysteine methyltransferase
VAIDLERITNLLGDLEVDSLPAAVEGAMAQGADPVAVLDAARAGMDIVGNRFAAQYYFVSELACSAELFNTVLDIIGPELVAKQGDATGPAVVLGTVQGDIHNIGKDLVRAMLAGNGFDVHDVGIDVPPQTFVDKVRETGATVVGLSGLLTVAFPKMEATIQALNDAGLRDRVKVMIGGGMVDEFIRRQVGADAWGKDAMEAVVLAKGFTSGGTI